MTRNAPDTPMVTNLSDVLSGLREMPSPSSQTPRSVPSSPPLPSTPPFTARAMRALRRDTVHTALENSTPSLMPVPQRALLPRKELPAKNACSGPSEQCFKYRIVT